MMALIAGYGRRYYGFNLSGKATVKASKVRQTYDLPLTGRTKERGFRSLADGRIVREATDNAQQSKPSRGRWYPLVRNIVSIYVNMAK